MAKIKYFFHLISPGSGNVCNSLLKNLIGNLFARLENGDFFSLLILPCPVEVRCLGMLDDLGEFVSFSVELWEISSADSLLLRVF